MNITQLTLLEAADFIRKLTRRTTGRKINRKKSITLAIRSRMRGFSFKSI